jgi:hypothetical protein
MLELLSLKTPFELMVAPNGARLTKLDHPKLPILINEISDTALACAEAGANAIHIHVRDSQNITVLTQIFTKKQSRLLGQKLLFTYKYHQKLQEFSM